MKEQDNMANSHMESQQPQPEFEPLKASWSQLASQARIETNPDKSNSYLAIMSDRIKSAENDLAILDVSALQQGIRETLDNSTWNDFYINLKRKGGDEEEFSKRAMTNYKESEEHHGMVFGIYDAIGKQISAIAMTNVPELRGKPKDRWTDEEWQRVGQRMRPGWAPNNIQEIKDLYDRNERYAEVDFASLVGLDVDELRRLISGKTPAQKEAEDRRRQIEEQNRAMRRGEQRSQLVGQPVRSGFEGSSVWSYGFDSSELVPNNNILIKRKIDSVEDQNAWVRDQLFAYASGRGANLDKNWIGVHKFWVQNDLRNAYDVFAMSHSDEENRRLEKTVDETERMTTRWLSVAAAGEAIFSSGGSGTAMLATYMGADSKGNPIPDNSDLIGHMFLTNNNDYLQKVYDDSEKHVANLNEGNEKGLQIKSVEQEFIGILSEMGADLNLDAVGDDRKKGKNRGNTTDNIVITSVDINKFLYKDGTGRNKEEKSLIYKKLFKGNFDDYINAKLDEEGEIPGVSREDRFLNKKMAVYAIMVTGAWDKWAEKVKMIEDFHQKSDGTYAEKDKIFEGLTQKISPSKNWGGAPLKSLRDNTVLVDDIKKQYQGRDHIVFDYIDEACRPAGYLKEWVIDKNGKPKRQYSDSSLLGNGNAKTLIRKYQQSWDAIGGSSRGTKIHDLERDGQALLQDFVELTDTLNGDDEYELLDGTIISGKQLTGYQITNLLVSKAIATTLASGEPTLAQRTLQKLFIPDDVRELPNSMQLQFLLGPGVDGRSGYISEIMGGRMRIKIEGEAKNKLNEAISLLKSNDQDDFWRGVGELLVLFGFALDVALVSAQVLSAGTGFEIPGVGGGGKRK